jgi:hypothetical protein
MDYEPPSFVVRSNLFPRRHYVFARWKDGREFKITRFDLKPNAIAWIADCSAEWLAEYDAHWRSGAHRP